MKVSIIIPCYNSEDYIEQSLLSALNQSYEKVNVICVDNESTDNSLEVIKNVQKKFNNLIVSEAPNLYEYSWEEPVAEAMKFCDSDYFTILASDDYLEKDYVEKNIEIIKKSNGKIKVMQSPLRGFSNLKDQFFPNYIKHSYKNLNEFKELLFKKCPVTTPTVFYKKELYDNNMINWNSKEDDRDWETTTL